MQNFHQFGELLTEGLYAVKRCEGAPLSKIQDDLGYALGRRGGSAVEKWRRHTLPPHHEDVAILSRFLRKHSCGQLSRDWFGRLLEAGNYPAVDALLSELFSSQTMSGKLSAGDTAEKELAPRLSEGLHAIRMQEGLPISGILADLLNENELPWVPYEQSLAELTSSLTPSELLTLLKAVNDRLHIEKPTSTTSPAAPLADIGIYPQSSVATSISHGQLVGRDNLVDNIVKKLRRPGEHKFIGIDGQGGIGKTAVAQEIVRRSYRLKLFEYVIWIAANHPTAADERSHSAISIDSVLNAIGRAVHATDIAGLDLVEKQKRVQSILTHNRMLIVLDNMETAADPQDDIIAQLRPLLGNSKVLLTSRHRFTTVYAAHLLGLSEVDAIQFMRQDGMRKGIELIDSLAPDVLTPVVDKTGGSPLAIQLIVGQMTFLPIDVILENLQQATPLSAIGTNQVDDGGEYVRFYKFIFARSWGFLDVDRKRLLVRLARFNSADGCDFASLRYVSEFDTPELISSIEALWKFSLLEVKAIEENAHRYFLHPLTHHFVLADIAKLL